jgi:type II secretory pathway component PulJ
MLTLTALLALLLLAAWVAYGDATAKEAVDAAQSAELHAQTQRWDALQRKHDSMDRAMTDMDGRCWICTAEANPLELVDSGARYDLACAACAHTVKTMKTLPQERAA